MTTNHVFRNAIERAAADGYAHNPRVHPFVTKRPTARPAVERPATGPQRNFLRKLVLESAQAMDDMDRREEGDAFRTFAENVLTSPVTAASASAAIDRAKDGLAALRVQALAYKVNAKADRAAARDELKNGAYRLADGTMVLVKHTRNTGVQVGYVWDAEAEKFEYSGRRILRGLTADMKLTLEQAQAFGRETVVCSECGIRLENETSIELGIGPICRGKF